MLGDYADWMSRGIEINVQFFPFFYDIPFFF